MFLLLFACVPVPEARTVLSPDLTPPQVLSMVTTGPREIVLEFNEPVMPLPDTWGLTPPLGLKEMKTRETKLHLFLQEDQLEGAEYMLKISVRDTNRNSMDYLAPFYGHNSRVPEVVINEFITQGSGKHPDVVELYLKSAGNMAGVALYEGVPQDWSHRLIFPSLEVAAGDYIIVHFKPQGIAEEVTEITARDQSGGYDACDTAWDFWVPGGSGLSGNNGVLTLYKGVEEQLLDAVLYSNRTSQSDERYRGFGTKRALVRADSLMESGGWRIAGEMIAPEDGINPDDSTGTRSICRSSSSEDTDSREDWHITPTRGSTFGTVNSEERYEP